MTHSLFLYIPSPFCLCLPLPVLCLWFSACHLMLQLEVPFSYRDNIHRHPAITTAWLSMTPDSTVAFGMSFGEPLSDPSQVQPLYGTARMVRYCTIRYDTPACFSVVMVTWLIPGQRRKQTGQTGSLFSWYGRLIEITSLSLPCRCLLCAVLIAVDFLC